MATPKRKFCISEPEFILRDPKFTTLPRAAKGTYWVLWNYAREIENQFIPFANRQAMLYQIAGLANGTPEEISEDLSALQANELVRMSDKGLDMVGFIKLHAQLKAIRANYGKTTGEDGLRRPKSSRTAPELLPECSLTAPEVLPNSAQPSPEVIPKKSRRTPGQSPDNSRTAGDTNKDTDTDTDTNTERDTERDKDTCLETSSSSTSKSQDKQNKPCATAPALAAQPRPIASVFPCPVQGNPELVGEITKRLMEKACAVAPDPSAPEEGLENEESSGEPLSLRKLTREKLARILHKAHCSISGEMNLRLRELFPESSSALRSHCIEVEFPRLLGAVLAAQRAAEPVKALAFYVGFAGDSKTPPEWTYPVVKRLLRELEEM